MFLARRYLLQEAGKGSFTNTQNIKQNVNLQQLHQELQQDKFSHVYYPSATLIANPQEQHYGTGISYQPPWHESEESDRRMQEFENRIVPMNPGTLPIGVFTWRGFKAIWQMGFKRVFWMIWQLREIKWGKLIGTDQYGNKYYEGFDHIPGRRRWVEFASEPYDASKVTPEWHGWLHYTIDIPPTDNPYMKNPPRYAQDYYPNLTGTDSAYHPSDTKKRVS